MGTEPVTDLAAVGTDGASLCPVVSALRPLAQVSPEAFLPGLGAALQNLAVRLGQAGRHAEALPVIEEAVRIWWQLAGVIPDAFLPALAMSLNTLADTLHALGDSGVADGIHADARASFPDASGRHYLDIERTAYLLQSRRHARSTGV
jgi:hypothetical protein